MRKHTHGALVLPAPGSFRLLRFALLVSITAWFALPTASSAPSLTDWARMKPIAPRSYVAHYTPTAIQVDGRPSEGAWQTAPWTEDFVDIEGDVKPRPRFRTRARMLWDEEFFYVAAELEEPHLWATLTKHDSVIFNDPDFEVFIDPDGDSHDYYEFELNALNTGWDLLLKKPYKDGGPALNGWEIPGLQTAVHLDGTLNDPSDRDRGWSLEIAFPWKVLAELARRPAPPREGDQWRVSFSRVQWLIDIVEGKYRKVPGKKEDNWVWSPQGIIDMHRPEKWGYVQFTRDKPGQTKFKPDPSAAARTVLQEIYYAQRDYRNKHKRWAATLMELGWTDPSPTPAQPPVLVTTPEGYRVTVAVASPGTAPQRWHIRQDARVWTE